MAQQCLESVIGRLVTDDEFREVFFRDRRTALNDLLERGMHLTAVELRALTSIDPTHWNQVAEGIDPRLQKASLKGL
jgi:hypothetical protein